MVQSTPSWKGPSASNCFAGCGGRLIFALDATASPQPTWDSACQLQADMFREAAGIGGLDVQLVYYRDRDECRAIAAQRLAALMERIDCHTGLTEIGKVFCPCQAGDSNFKYRRWSSSVMR